MAGEFTDPRGKLNTLILFNGHSNELTSQFSSLYPVTAVAFKVHQGSVRVQWMVIKQKLPTGESSESAQPQMGIYAILHLSRRLRYHHEKEG